MKAGGPIITEQSMQYSQNKQTSIIVTLETSKEAIVIYLGIIPMVIYFFLQFWSCSTNIEQFMNEVGNI